MKTSRLLCLIPTMVFGAALVACSSSSSGGNPPGPDASTDTGGGTDSGGGMDSSGAPSITGTAMYSGSHSGTLALVVAAFLPPLSAVQTEAPSGYFSDTMATWPGSDHYTMTDVPPGQYYVLAYISTGGTHLMGPQAGDPQGAYSDSSGMPITVTVTAGQPVTANLTLMDPAPPADAGSDAPADSGSDAPADSAGD